MRGCVSAHGIMGNLHICEGTINAARYIQVLEQHRLLSKRCLFQGHPRLFLHVSQQHSCKTVEQPNSYMKQEWERIPPTRLQQLLVTCSQTLIECCLKKRWKKKMWPLTLHVFLCLFPILFLLSVSQCHTDDRHGSSAAKKKKKKCGLKFKLSVGNVARLPGYLWGRN